MTIEALVWRVRLVGLGLAAAFLVWGFVQRTGRLSHGSAWGPRTPETLADPAAWRAACRVLGEVALGTGVFFLAVAFSFERLPVKALFLLGAVWALAFPAGLAASARAGRRVYRERHGDRPPRRVGPGRYLPPAAREET